MADIRTKWQILRGDWQAAFPGLATDDGLESACIISLFTDCRAKPADIPEGEDPRGWWGDSLDDDGDQIGSHLWLLSREKLIPETVRRAREYAKEALAWLVSDGVARRVDVQAEVIGRGVLGLAVEIYRPNNTSVKYQFKGFWEGI